MAKDTGKKNTEEKIVTEKETRGEVKKKFKSFHFPELNKNIMAENLGEAIEKVSKK